MKITLANGYMEAEIEPEDLILERPCPTCLVGRSPSGADCSTCNGRGIVVTPLGLHILSFVVKTEKAYLAGKI
jgi:DnaJ-class molecular chaperone